MNPKISVIIPVYKVEMFLHQCLESVVNQTYRNLEIIIVDDGSPDQCGKICDEYAIKDPRIKVIHKDNEGLSAARNDALKVATGEWISFVDSDDWCELDLYEKAVAKAEITQADIVIFSSFRNTPSRQLQIHAFAKEFETKDRKIISKLQCAALNQSFMPFPSNQHFDMGLPWDKLYRSSLFAFPQLKFPENVKAAEDVIFNIHAFQFAQSVAFFDIPLYHWRINPESIGHRYTENRVEVDQQIYEELIKIGDQYQLSPEYYEAVDAKVITNMINLGHRCLFHSKREGNLFSKIKYAREVLNSEPIYTACRRVDKSRVGKLARLVAQSRNPWMLYGATIIIRNRNK